MSVKYSDYIAAAIAECEGLADTTEYEPATDLDAMQRRIGLWGDATFGAGDRGSAVLAHLAEEVAELVASEEPEEAADCALLLLQFAHRRGFSLCRAIEAKHAVNQARQWGEPDAQGVVRHIREEVQRQLG